MTAQKHDKKTETIAMTNTSQELIAALHSALFFLRVLARPQDEAAQTEIRHIQAILDQHEKP